MLIKERMAKVFQNVFGGKGHELKGKVVTGSVQGRCIVAVVVALCCLGGTLWYSASFSSNNSNNNTPLLATSSYTQPYDAPPLISSYQDFMQRRNFTRFMVDEQWQQFKAQYQTDPPILSSFHQDFSQTHPVLAALDPRYAPDPAWSMADIHIAGHARAGVSFLYNILTHSGSAVPWNPEESNACVLQEQAPNTDVSYDTEWRYLTDTADSAQNVTDATLYQKKLYRYYQAQHEHAVEEHTTSDKMTVHGCMWTSDIQLSYYYLQSQMKQPPKFIYILRDPADLLYSIFRHYNLPTWDTTLRKRIAAPMDPLHHWRSPRLFHEMILSGEKSRPGHALLKWLSQPRRRAHQLVSFAGSDNVLFVKYEDILAPTAPTHFLSQLAAFTGLDANDLQAAWTHVRSTVPFTTQQVSTDVTATLHALMEGPLMPETRTLVYLYAYPECQAWKQAWNVEYLDCLNIFDTEPVDTPKVSATTTAQ
jgi:hypothetical protein